MAVGHLFITFSRLEGTLASIALSVWNGADIVRVHDVKKAKKTVVFTDAVMRV